MGFMVGSFEVVGNQPNVKIPSSLPVMMNKVIKVALHRFSDNFVTSTF